VPEVTDYITPALYKSRYGITLDDKDVRIAEHITAASRRVDGICHREFGVDTVATARYFRPLDCRTVYIDDAHAITSVAIDANDSGLYATTWAVADYETDPANGVGPDGQTGWPVTALRAFDTVELPTTNRRRAIKVTAKWGWAAVPTDVVEATYLLTARLAYEIAVPGGVTPPSPEFGLPGQALQRPYTAEGLLKPYMRTDRVIGVAG
jgi:hypothetical protein